MYINYEHYHELGYDAVPEKVFGRYLAKAEACVGRYTQGRIVSMEGGGVAELNRRGVCELVELYFLADHPHSELARGKRTLLGFRNRDYEERYEGGADEFGINDVMELYFTPDQRWRGVGQGGG